MIKAGAAQADVAQADAQRESKQRAAQLDGLTEHVKALEAQAGVAQSDAQSESRQRAAQLDGITEQVKALAAEAGAQMDQLMDQSNALVAKLGDVHAVVAKTKSGTSGQWQIPQSGRGTHLGIAGRRGRHRQVRLPERQAQVSGIFLEGCHAFAERHQGQHRPRASARGRRLVVVVECVVVRSQPFVAIRRVQAGMHLGLRRIADCDVACIRWVVVAKAAFSTGAQAANSGGDVTPRQPRL